MVTSRTRVTTNKPSIHEEAEGGRERVLPVGGTTITKGVMPLKEKKKTLELVL